MKRVYFENTQMLSANKRKRKNKGNIKLNVNEYAFHNGRAFVKTNFDTEQHQQLKTWCPSFKISKSFRLAVCVRGIFGTTLYT
jgi:hypothetical protein